MSKLTTFQAEFTLLSYLDFRRKLIVPRVTALNTENVSIWHECDLLMLSPAGYATEVEIKVSKSDLRADFKKSHSHESQSIKYFYYAVPSDLVQTALTLIPSRAGLYELRYNSPGYYNVIVIRKALARSDAIKWGIKDRAALARLGAMRIYNLMARVNELNLILESKGL